MLLFLDEDILHERLGLLDSKANFWAHQAPLSMESSRQEYWRGEKKKRRILEWVAIPFSRGSCQPRDWTHIFCIAGRLFIVWVIREALGIKRKLLRICKCLLFGFRFALFSWWFSSSYFYSYLWVVKSQGYGQLYYYK